MIMGREMPISYFRVNFIKIGVKNKFCGDLWETSSLVRCGGGAQTRQI